MKRRSEKVHSGNNFADSVSHSTLACWGKGKEKRGLAPSTQKRGEDL